MSTTERWWLSTVHPPKAIFNRRLARKGRAVVVAQGDALSVQKRVLELSERGVTLTVSSKNDDNSA